MSKRERRNQDAMRAGQAAWDAMLPEESDDAACPCCEFECSGEEARTLEGVCHECESVLEAA